MVTDKEKKDNEKEELHDDSEPPKVIIQTFIYIQYIKTYFFKLSRLFFFQNPDIRILRKNYRDFNFCI